MVSFGAGLLQTAAGAGAGGFKAYGEAAQGKLDAAKEAAIAKRQATRDKILAGYGMKQAEFTAGARAGEAEKGREFSAGQGLLEREATAAESKLGREATTERDRIKQANDLAIARVKSSQIDPEDKKLQLDTIKAVTKGLADGSMNLPQANQALTNAGLTPYGETITGTETEGGFLGMGGTETPVTEVGPQANLGVITGQSSDELSQALQSLGPTTETKEGGQITPIETRNKGLLEQKEVTQLEINPELPEDLKKWQVQDLQDDKGVFKHYAFIPGKREPVILTEEEYQYWVQNRAPERETQEPYRGGLVSPYAQ